MLKPSQICLSPVTGQGADSCANSASSRDVLINTAHRRLYPALVDPNYLVLRSRRMIFSTWASELRGESLEVLDIGGKYQPYRLLLGTNVARYIAVDLIKTELVDVVADGERLPFVPETFDLVIATQVMDYFRDPAMAAKQIHAVLKPGGVLFASAPSCAPRFADEERWRFTPAGWRSVLAPFDQVEIVPELYSVGSVFRTVNLILDTFVRYRFARAIYRRTACPFLNLMGLGFEKLNLTSNDQFAANYSVRATKAK